MNYFKLFFIFELTARDLFYTTKTERYWNGDWYSEKIIHTTTFGKWFTGKPIFLYWISYALISSILCMLYVFHLPVYMIYSLFKAKKPYE